MHGCFLRGQTQQTMEAEGQEGVTEEHSMAVTWPCWKVNGGLFCRSEWMMPGKGLGTPVCQSPFKKRQGRGGLLGLLSLHLLQGNQIFSYSIVTLWQPLET